MPLRERKIKRKESERKREREREREAAQQDGTRRDATQHALGTSGAARTLLGATGAHAPGCGAVARAYRRIRLRPEMCSRRATAAPGIVSVVTVNVRRV